MMFTVQDERIQITEKEKLFSKFIFLQNLPFCFELNLT